MRVGRAEARTFYKLHCAANITADSKQQPPCTHLGQLPQSVQRVDVGRGQPLVPAAAGRRAGRWAGKQPVGEAGRAARPRDAGAGHGKAGIARRQETSRQYTVQHHSSRHCNLYCQHSPHHAVVVELDLLHSPQRRLQQHSTRDRGGAWGEIASEKRIPPSHAGHSSARPPTHPRESPKPHLPSPAQAAFTRPPSLCPAQPPPTCIM